MLCITFMMLDISATIYDRRMREKVGRWVCLSDGCIRATRSRDQTLLGVNSRDGALRRSTEEIAAEVSNGAGTGGLMYRGRALIFRRGRLPRTCKRAKAALPLSTHLHLHNNSLVRYDKLVSYDRLLSSTRPQPPLIIDRPQTKTTPTTKRRSVAGANDSCS